jgi:hypothetical protein
VEQCSGTIIRQGCNGVQGGSGDDIVEDGIVGMSMSTEYATRTRQELFRSPEKILEHAMLVPHRSLAVMDVDPFGLRPSERPLNCSSRSVEASADGSAELMISLSRRPPVGWSTSTTRTTAVPSNTLRTLSASHPRMWLAPAPLRKGAQGLAENASQNAVPIRDSSVCEARAAMYACWFVGCVCEEDGENAEEREFCGARRPKDCGGEGVDDGERGGLAYKCAFLLEPALPESSAANVDLGEDGEGGPAGGDEEEVLKNAGRKALSRLLPDALEEAGFVACCWNRGSVCCCCCWRAPASRAIWAQRCIL